MTHQEDLAVAIDLDLDEELFRALGASVRDAQGPISPWKGVDLRMTKRLRARLKGLGIDDANLTPEALHATVAAIAGATGLTTVRIAGANVLMDYMAFASKDQGPIALYATARDGKVRLEDPAPSDTLVEFVAGLVGRSHLRGLDLTLDLRIDDAFVLAALVDLQRRHTLSHLAEGHPLSGRPVRVDALRAGLEKPPVGPFWLLDAISGQCAVEPSHAAVGIHESLARLAQEELVETTPSTATLAGPCAGLAEHFLAVTSVIGLDNVHDDGQGGVARIGFSCVQSGVTDLITVEWIQQGIHLETVSADTVVGYIDRLVHRPDLAVSSPPSNGARPSAPWTPTHFVPPKGLPAWKTPSASVRPETMLAAGLELRTRRLSEGWAEVEAVNGWSGWVDSQSLEELGK